MTVDFSSETMEAKRKWHTISQVLKEKICIPSRNTFRNEEEIKAFSNERKLRICHQQTYPKEKGQRKFFKQRGNDKRRNLETSENKKKHGREKYG